MKFSLALFTAPLVLALAAGVGCSGTTPTGGGDNTTTGGSATDDGKVIAGIDLTPEKATLSQGSTQQFRAIVRYADGTTEDITNSPDVIWNTSEPTVATVTKNGVVTASKAGLANISVEYKGEKESESFVVTP
ncbi:MAG: Ig-like domain-containing protein [Byssovorax sp.]